VLHQNDAASGSEDALRLAQLRRVVGNGAEGEAEDDRIEGLVRKIELLGVALP
jgi:hypothetical protein